MVPTRVAFKNQLQAIFDSACYTAFGQIPLPLGHGGIRHVRQDGRLKYRVQIANSMYEHYRRDDFKFCDHGITPKGLAEDIEVHLTDFGGLVWEIDYFGNFIVSPSDSHLLSHKNLNPFEFFLTPEYQAATLRPQPVHLFNFYADQHSTVGHLMRLRLMEAQARVASQLNGATVVRKVFTDWPASTEEKRCNIKAAKQTARLLFSQAAPLNIYDMGKIEMQQQLGPAISYFCCCPSTLVHYSNLLPSYRLLAPHLQKDHPYPILSLQTQTLCAKLGVPTVEQRAEEEMHKLMEGAEQGEVMLYFGDLLDNYEFGRVLLLLEWASKQPRYATQYIAMKECSDHILGVSE